MPVYNPVLQLLLGGREGAAYKSMSWSTSSRERAKLGRLDSEPPLLLREWPPETGRRDKGESRGGGETNTGKQEDEEGEKQRSGSHNEQTQQSRKGREV